MAARREGCESAPRTRICRRRRCPLPDVSGLAWLPGHSHLVILHTHIDRRRACRYSTLRDSAAPRKAVGTVLFAAFPSNCFLRRPKELRPCLAPREHLAKRHIRRSCCSWARSSILGRVPCPIRRREPRRKWLNSTESVLEDEAEAFIPQFFSGAPG